MVSTVLLVGKRQQEAGSEERKIPIFLGSGSREEDERTERRASDRLAEDGGRGKKRKIMEHTKEARKGKKAKGKRRTPGERRRNTKERNTEEAKKDTKERKRIAFGTVNEFHIMCNDQINIHTQHTAHTLNDCKKKQRFGIE